MLARELANRADWIIANNQLKVPTETVRIVSNLSYEVVAQNSNLTKRYIGLTSSQFKILYVFLDGIYPLKLRTFWSFQKNNQVPIAKKKSGRLSKISSQEKLYICLLRLKTGFSIVTLSHLLSCHGRTIKETTIRTIFTSPAKDTTSYASNRVATLSRNFLASTIKPSLQLFKGIVVWVTNKLSTGKTIIFGQENRFFRMWRRSFGFHTHCLCSDLNVCPNRAGSLISVT